MRKKKVEGHKEKCKSKEKRRMRRRQMVTEERRKVRLIEGHCKMPSLKKIYL
jgi:hypothetical protein